MEAPNHSKFRLILKFNRSDIGLVAVVRGLRACLLIPATVNLSIYTAHLEI